MAGVGNVFRSEILFIERVAPSAPVASLDDPIVGLIATARTLLLANVDDPRPPDSQDNPWRRRGRRQVSLGLRTGGAAVPPVQDDQPGSANRPGSSAHRMVVSAMPACPRATVGRAMSASVEHFPPMAPKRLTPPSRAPDGSASLRGFGTSSDREISPWPTIRLRQGAGA